MSVNPGGLKKSSLLPVLIIAIFAIGLYSNTLKNGFVYDDADTIVNNTLIKSLGNLPLLFDKTAYFSRSEETSYRPVVTFTYFIDYAVYGLKPWGYHLTNVLFHAINGVLLYFLLTLLLTPPASRLASLPFLISLLFVAHPVLTEAVNCVSYREDLLAFLFYMTTLSLYLVARKPATDHSPLTTVLLYILSCLTYSLALLSKEMAVTLPLIIFSYEWFYGKGKDALLSRLSNLYLMGYIATTIFYLYLRFDLFYNPGEQIKGWSLLERVLTLPWLIMNYLKLGLIPVHLSADYVINPVNSLLSPMFIFTTIPVISILAIIVIIRNTEKSILFGALFFLITLAPVYNLVALSNPFAERYLYLPSAGLIMFTVSVTCLIVEELKITQRNRYLSMFCLAVFIIFSFSVINRNAVWRGDTSLWSDTVTKMPNSERAHNNLGLAYQKKGQLNEAIREYLTALKFNPDYAKAHINLGIAYGQQGRYDEAVFELINAIRLNPGYADAYYDLGLSYQLQGRYEQAINEYLTAVSLKPDNAAAHYNLGIVYFKQSRPDDAINEFAEALKWKPDFKEAYQNLEELRKRSRGYKNTEVINGSKFPRNEQGSLNLGLK